DYTLSFIAKAEKSVKVNTGFIRNLQEITIGTEWAKYTLHLKFILYDAINFQILTANTNVFITHIKSELSTTATPYLKDGDYMKYTGTSVKDSNNPTDYDWAKTSAKHTDVDEAVVIAKKYTDTHINLIPDQITAGVSEAKE